MSFTEDNEVRDRWKESFKHLFNKESPEDSFIIQAIPTILEECDEPNSLLQEVQIAIRNLKTGQALGFDGESAEQRKAAREVGVKTKKKSATTRSGTPVKFHKTGVGL